MLWILSTLRFLVASEGGLIKINNTFLVFAFLIQASTLFAVHLPDPLLTPGKICTEKDVDFKGFDYPAKMARCNRNIGHNEKQLIAQNYGNIPEAKWNGYEFDHYLPLCAGGSNDIKNLWPQPLSEASQKDKLEVQICTALRAGVMTQAEALQKVHDWFNAAAKNRRLQILSDSLGNINFTNADSKIKLSPSCMAKQKELAVNNSDVINWRKNSPNQFRARAHIVGSVIKTYPDHSGHQHFEMQIGNGTSDKIEIISNRSFGVIPNLKPGAAAEICGDYITSNATAGSFPASPDGAIVHWVHRSPQPRSHESGYVMIDGVLYGQGQGKGYSIRNY